MDGIATPNRKGLIMETVKINHDAYTATHQVDGALIVCFRVGYVEFPPKDVIAAFTKIKKLLSEVEDEITLVLGWQGSVSLYAPISRDVNPEMTNEQIEGFRAATIAAYPGYRIVDEWQNQMSGLDGYSIRIAKNI